MKKTFLVKYWFYNEMEGEGWKLVNIQELDAEGRVRTRRGR